MKSQNIRLSTKHAKSNVALFPLLLHDILDRAEAENFQHIIGWMPDGRSFKIHQPEKVLPILQLFGMRQSRWKSFLRQLQNYGFHRETQGPRRGVCRHDLFVRGWKDLCLEMPRIKRSHSVDDLMVSQLSQRMEPSRSTLALPLSSLHSQIAPFGGGPCQVLRRTVSEDFSPHNDSICLAIGRSRNEAMQDVRTESSRVHAGWREDDPIISSFPFEVDVVEKATNQALKDPLLFGELLDSLREKSRDQMNTLFEAEASLEETFGRSQVGLQMW